VSLTEECSAITKNNVPPKLLDPGSFSIPCSIGDELEEICLDAYEVPGYTKKGRNGSMISLSIAGSLGKMTCFSYSIPE